MRTAAWMTTWSAGALLAAVQPGQAQAPAAPPPAAPRARGPMLDVSVDLARAAIAACAASGYKVTALVTDVAGVPVAMLSADGASERTQQIAPSKIAMVVKYREASGVTLARSKTDAALAAALTGDPKIGTPRQGALPLTAGGTMIGVIAVSGAPGGDKDEVCAKAALDKAGAQLR